MNSRTIPLPLSGLIAVFSALVALALSGHHQMSAMAATPHKINAQALQMADMLSSGLVAQFPGRFR